MNDTPWYRHPKVRDAVREILIALLLALLSILSYDRLVAEPRMREAETAVTTSVITDATPDVAGSPAE